LRRELAAMVVALTIISGCAKPAVVAQDLRLDDGRQWLEGQATPPSTSPDLLRAAAANALNQVPASESLLKRVINANPTSDSARRAHMLLSRLYLRQGQYQRLIANLDEWARQFPGGADIKDERAAMEQFRGLPDQITVARGLSNLSHGPDRDFAAPATINGKPVNYLLDTGAWLSVLTEAEAKRLGMVIREGAGVLSDPSGKGAKVRTDVSFAILPDVEPFRSMELGRAGILGIPILLEAGCMRWVKGGTWELGCATASSRDSMNLVFFENHLLVAATVSGTSVFGVLDTGAETTDLNANFARQFADALARNGVKDTTTIAGVGGTTAVESVTLPTVDFEIGGTQVALRPAHVTMQRTSALGGKCCVGNIGLDLLLQTGALTIDFKTMKVRLR
jgi:predicted aspartyl protease